MLISTITDQKYNSHTRNFFNAPRKKIALLLGIYRGIGSQSRVAKQITAFAVILVCSDRSEHMLYTLYRAVIARKYIWVKENVSFAHVWGNIKKLLLTLTAQNQLWLNTCVKQALTLRGMILESLPLTIVMVNGFVWKPGISMRPLVP